MPSKDKIEFFIDPVVKKKFQIYAEKQGLTMSSYLRSFITRTVNEEDEKLNAKGTNNNGM